LPVNDRASTFPNGSVAGISSVVHRPLRVAALAGGLLLAGCGGQAALSKKALQQEAKSVQALAAEGGLLAGDAARGRSTTVFVRVHAGYLRKAAGTSTTLLAKGRTPPARRLARIAGRVSADLDRLSRSGSDHAQQRRLEQELTQAANALAKIGKKL
jgi:hypothetical protein